MREVFGERGIHEHFTEPREPLKTDRSRGCQKAGEPQ